MRRLVLVLVAVGLLANSAGAFAQRSEGIAPEDAPVGGKGSARTAVAGIEARLNATIKTKSEQLEAEREVVAERAPAAQRDQARVELLRSLESQMRSAPRIAPISDFVGRTGTGSLIVRGVRSEAEEAASRTLGEMEEAVEVAAATQAQVSQAERQKAALRQALGTGGAVENKSGIAGIPTTGWGSSGTQPVTVESLDRYLESRASPIAGSGRSLLIAGAKYDVDPRFVVAIAGAESSFGLTLCAPFNAWGWGCPSGPYTFRSWDEAIDTITKGLRKGYLEDGLTTVESIHRRYAPPAATNDPTGLNLVWARNVATFLLEQGGDPADVTGPGPDAVKLGLD